MDLQRALKIFNRFSHRNKTTWQIDGVAPNQFITDAGTNPKFNEFESKAIASRILQRELKNATPQAESTTIDIKQDADEDNVYAFIVLDSNKDIISFAKVTDKGKAEVSNLPEGNYKIISISDNGEALKTESITIVKPIIETPIP